MKAHKKNNKGSLALVVALGVLCIGGVAVYYGKDIALKFRGLSIAATQPPIKCTFVGTNIDTSQNGGAGISVQGNVTPCLDKVKTHHNEGPGVEVKE